MKIINSDETIKKPLVWLEINRKALLFNVKQLKQLNPSAKIMAAVKANAYGLSVVGVAKTIEKKVDAFGIVGIKEGILLRDSGITKPIVNLGIYSSDDAVSLINNNISPIIFTKAGLNDFARYARKLKKIASVWIKVDTGLNRLGVPYLEALEFIRTVNKIKNIKIAGVYSSLTEDKNFDKIQLKRFLTIKDQCQVAKIEIPIWSLASSEAAFLLPEAALDMVRCGLSLFGYYPSSAARAKRIANLKPAVSFKTRIACLKELEPGESVYYRRKFITKNKTRIAVLLAGYSYGLDSRLVNGGQVLINGRKYPLVGGIAMTNCFVDIGNNKAIKAGDEAVILGKQKNQSIKLEEICRVINQNEYEFLSRIPEKVERLYL